MKPLLALERAGPLAFAWIGPVAFFAAKRNGWSPQVSGATDLLSGTASLGAVMIGFVFAAKSILLAMNAPAITWLEKADKLGRFFTYLFDDVLVWIVTTVAALVLLTAQPSATAPDPSSFMRLVALWTALPCLGIAMSGRSMLILSAILRMPRP